MTLSNVMPLYPQTQPPEPQSHSSGARKEGSVESRGKGFRDSRSSVADEPCDLDKGHSQLPHPLSVSEQNEKLDKPEKLSESFRFLI